MAEYKRIILLILTMSVVVASATGIAIGVLYDTAYERQRLQLVDTAKMHALLLDAIARFDRQYRHDYPGTAEEATLAQIRTAFESEHGIAGTSELTLGRRAGDQIVFLMRHRHVDSGTPAPVAWESGLAEPMRRALGGHAGTMTGLDYHGAKVLAAYEPVAALDLGVVAKIDLSEVRAPFFSAGAIVIGVAMTLILAGTLLFLRLTNPMLRTLRDREEQLDLILDSTGEGKFGMDLQGRCVFANRAALQMLGYGGPDELLGRHIHELIHHTRTDGSPHPREDCPTSAALALDEPVHVEEEMLWRADGTGFPAEYHSYPMHRDGRIVGAVVSFVDITERKEKELELLQAQKMEVIGRLTGGIAHDFNNLLTIILGNIRLLQQDAAAAWDDDAGELLDDALSAAEDGAALTHGLLAFSRKETLRPEAIEINAFLRENHRFLSRVTGDAFEIELALAPGRLGISADPRHLQTALLNLVINAADAMSGGGTIVIGTALRRPTAWRSADETPQVLVTVADQGHGMSPEVASRAIEPFFTTKGIGTGSGLGLSMVYGFAAQSGGGLEIETKPGRGTTVVLSLPGLRRLSAIVGPREVGTVQHSPDEPALVLLVEDEARVRRLTARAIMALGHRVLEASDADEARAILEDEPEVGLLVSDILMPGEMDGCALARWARQHSPRLRILLTTAQSDLPPENCSRDFHILHKPFDDRELREAIAETRLDSAA